MARTKIVHWNGKDLPAEMRDLPAGQYVVAAVEESGPLLTPEEEAGLETALRSYAAGRTVDARTARALLNAARRR